MAVLNRGLFRQSIVDHDGQKRRISFHCTLITALNFAQQQFNHDKLVEAIEDVTLGARDYDEHISDQEMVRPIVRAANAAAQANVQWLVTYVDDANSSVYTVKIPTADVTNTDLFMPNSKVWNQVHAKWVEFISRFETHVKSPDMNTVTILSIEYVQP